MEKVEIFLEGIYYTQELKRKFNEWSAKNTTIKIVRVLQTTHDKYVILSVFYVEKSEIKKRRGKASVSLTLIQTNQLYT